MSHSRVISHRACAGLAPENTVAGVQFALDLGVDGIEIDVWASADGIPVLMHDPSVDRTTNGSGPVGSLKAASLRQLDAGFHGFEGHYGGVPVPALREIVQLTLHRCQLIVEIKQAGIANSVIDVLRQMDALDWSMIWSFDLETVVEAHRLEPNLPAMLLVPPATEYAIALLGPATERGLSGLSVHYSRVGPELTREAKRQSLAIYAWTVDEPVERRRLIDCGVDGIVTNLPPILQATLADEG